MAVLIPEESLGLQDAPNVTDAGVLSFIMMCGNLQCLTLAGNLRLRGGFLPVLLTRCTKLTSLTITGAPDFYLGSAQHPLMDIAPNPSIRHLALEGMGTDSDLIGLCQKLPSLHTLAVDGPPNALQTVVCQWCARCLHAKAPSPCEAPYSLACAPKPQLHAMQLTCVQNSRGSLQAGERLAAW